MRFGEPMRRPILLVAAAAALLGACDTRVNPLITSLDQSPGGSAGFSVSPNSLRLSTGQSAQLSVISSRALAPYNWSTSQPGVATVSPTGLVSAVGPGLATITVTSSVDGSVSAAAIVSVQAASPSQ